MQITLAAKNTDGHTEYPFTVEYIDPEGYERSVAIYACNYEDAVCHLVSLKTSATIAGQIIGRCPSGDHEV